MNFDTNEFENSTSSNLPFRSVNIVSNSDPVILYILYNILFPQQL